MKEFTPEERAAFVEAASAFLAQREKIEFYREQAVAATGAKTGKGTMKQTEASLIVELSDRLYRLLLKLKQQHPMTAAIRFRKHLFFLIQQKGQVVGMHVIPEAGIASIEG